MTTQKLNTRTTFFSKIGFIPVLAATMMIFAGSANATCSTYGKVVKVYHKSNTSTPYAYGYIQPKSTGPVGHWVYFFTNKPQTISMLNSAQAGNETVYVKGKSSCSGSGAYRYGGTIDYMNAYDLY